MMFTVDEILKATGGRLIAGKRNLSCLSICTDSRRLHKGDLFVAIKGKNFDGHDFIKEAIAKGAPIIIVGRDFRFDINHPYLKDYGTIAFIKVSDSVKALGDIARYHRQRFNIPVVAVTGSCGKTTTKEMIYEVLSANFNVLKNEGTFNNFIGLPLTLLRLNKDTDIAVVEIGSSNQGEVVRLADISRPNLGIITNIGPAHLEFFGTVNSILEEKYSLIENLCSPRLGILNVDDKLLKKKIKTKKSKTVFTFGIDNRADFMASDIKETFAAIQFRLNAKHRFRLNVLGRHNVYNALAAIASGVIFGIDYKALKTKLGNFVLPPTRINFKKIKDYQVIDDTYNSNPLSLSSAIDVLRKFNTKGKKIFVMGDMLELGKKSILLHREIGRRIIKSKIDTLITVGPLSSFTANFIKNKRSDLRVYSCGSILEAKGVLGNLISAHDLVLVKGSRAMQMEKIIDNLE